MEDVNRGHIKPTDQLYQLKALQDVARKEQYLQVSILISKEIGTLDVLLSTGFFFFFSRAILLIAKPENNDD